MVDTLSIHGLPRLLSNKNGIVKFVWLVIFLVSVCAGLANIGLEVKDYLHFDVITNIERISPESYIFPAIAVCTTSFYRANFKNGTQVGLRNATDDFEYKKFISGYISPVLDNDINNLEYYSFYSFAQFHCVRFNGITNRSLVTISSTSKSLAIRTKNVYREVISDNEYIEYSLSGLFVFITDNYLNSFNTDPLPIKVEPLSFSLGKSYNIRIEKTDIEYKLGRPHNNCTDSYPETGEKNYRQANCIEKCINKEIEQKYNCSLSSYYENKLLRRCDYYLIGFKYGLSYECEKKCPRQCESAKLVFKTTEDYSLNGYTALWFHMSDLSFFKITQIPKMNEFSLISSIGGSLGLFIGISFLSFIEILDFLIEVLYIIYAYR